MKVTPFIAIEGPIGIGKTSLANKLSNHFEFHLLNEIVEENPFLGKFYQDIEAWSFQTEMFFLCNRYKQLEDIEREYLCQKKAVIADYHISKNMIFARRTLKGMKFRKYEQVYHTLVDDMPTPNILIYIYGSIDTILDRIKHRDRDVEREIQTSYLIQLAKDYETFMDQFEILHPEVPVIRINGDKIDFVKNDNDLNAIIHELSNYLKL